MAFGRDARPALAFGMAAGLAGCAPTAETALDVETGLAGSPPVPGDAAEQVQALTARRDTHDQDGDGFVSPAEAEGYYRRYFGQLDDNHDGRLSRAELEPEAPGTPDLELAYEELVGASEQEYLDDRLGNYNLRADRTIGMMSTRDFDEMVGTADPAISGPRPGIEP